jgi:hypothetical protein
MNGRGMEGTYEDKERVLGGGGGAVKLHAFLTPLYCRYKRTPKIFVSCCPVKMKGLAMNRKITARRLRIHCQNQF